MTHDFDLEVLRELHPPVVELVGSEAAEAAEARERARTLLLSEMAAPSADRKRWPAPLTLRRPRRRRLSPLITLSGAVALAVAIAVAVSLQGGAANPPSAAAAVLQRASRAAAASSDRWRLRADEYWYVKSYWTTAGAQVADPSVRGGLLVIVDALTKTEEQTWTSPDRPGLDVRHITPRITFLSAAAREQWIRAGRPRQVFTSYRARTPADSFIEPYRQLLALPTTPDALWRLLEKHAGPPPRRARDAEVFTEIGDLLRDQPIPSRVRAALYLLATRIPGIELAGRTHDGIGRPALAVGFTYAGIRQDLLFDPHTYALLGERSVVVNPPPAYHVKPGSVRTGATYVSFGIVKRIGQVATPPRG